ncbi:MAG: SIS domain-containing protein [Gammaproteobacteria bacterium]|nr:SIS domain-containing protein [Gammaproteobacteria bacterium]
MDLKQSLAQHHETMQSLIQLEAGLHSAIEQIRACFKAEKKLLVCGNGGSAADAQHFAAEFSGRFEQDRLGFPAFALTTDSSAMTAIANDYGYEQIFARQIESVGFAGDVLLAISTSGNSANIVQAVNQAKQQQMFTIGLQGRDGGELAQLVDLALTVETHRTSRIQEAHIFLLHYICEAFESGRDGF